ncbi:MAG: aldehyde ferredoxin oxidoreductase family protein [Candidatus Bathyarchaeia archaeon]|nr:aldehyde ferredoxin oxidoreductase family protein [Candidatus Bathyarchaeota archaeon]
MSLLWNVLYIDLSRRDFWVEDRGDLFDRWLGGIGVAIQLFKEEVKPDADPLGPDNVIVFAIGPLTCLYPMASKTVAVFKSPLTGNLGESHAGGRSAVAIRMAGYGAIVVKGASDIPVYLTIGDGTVRFRDASVLWGVRSTITVGRILREREGKRGLRTIMRIGRAGENLVRYACVITETYRHFGRLGLGAVFGSKKLKAIVVYGRESIPVKNPVFYRRVYDDIYDLAVKSELMKKYHDIGTSMNVNMLNTIKGLPTMNLRSSYFDKAEFISGEYLAETRLGRRIACSHCPIACIHLAALREPYKGEPYFYKTTYVSYDYEPIYALGSMLGISDTDGLLRLLDTVEIYGLDAMSTGVVLAWATEAYEKGLVTIKDTLIELRWGYVEGYLQAIRYIVDQVNQFYRDLSLGVDHASRIYGGVDYALAFGGNEMPGYSTGYGAYLTYLTGGRHSHLDSAGYSLDEKLLGKQYPPPEQLIDMLLAEETWRQILSSLVICFFARGIYTVDKVIEALKALGVDYSRESLTDLGFDIYKEKYRVKMGLGFDLDSLRIPRRIFETESCSRMLDESYINAALEYFKAKIRGMLS